MNIIEKLGRTPIDSYNFDGYFAEGEGWDYCHEGEVRKVEQQKNELLNLLANVVNAQYNNGTLAALNNRISESRDYLIKQFPKIKALLNA